MDYFDRYEHPDGEDNIIKMAHNHVMRTAEMFKPNDGMLQPTPPSQRYGRFAKSRLGYLCFVRALMEMTLLTNALLAEADINTKLLSVEHRQATAAATALAKMKLSPKTKLPKRLQKKQ